jgi:hypothetical protein
MTRNTLPILYSVLGFSLAAISPPALLGQTQSSTYRPGAIDPAGSPSNFTLFRDQQLFVMSPGMQGSPWPTAVASFDANLNPTATVAQLPWSSAIPWQQVDIQAVSGRIVHPDKDDIVIAHRYEADGTKLAVRMRDGSGLTLLDNLEDRIQSWTDLFSTAEGDLDKLYDPQGNYHDEVVVAWMAHEQLPRSGCPDVAVPYIAVLNYNGGGTPSVLTQRIDRTDGTYMSTCTMQGYDYLISEGVPMQTTVPQPVDNIIATAVGDFDGDGFNEIAVAYMRETPATVITVAIYRYQNDGTTASLSPVNTFDIARPAGRSAVGTLSLASGNFDGSGTDELLVGTADWWGTSSGTNTYQSGTFQTQPVLFLLKGGQVWGNITGASSNGSNTQFTVSLGNGVYIPQVVTITGAVGSWTAINGTWQVTLTPNGFSIPVDSSTFAPINGQTPQFSAAAALTQTDSMQLLAFPGLSISASGPLEIGDTDKDGRIRVQLVPGLFHFDPSNGLDYRRRQIAMTWNARPTPSQDPNAAKDGDAHLAILQITNDDKISEAIVTNGAVMGFQTFQTLTLAAGAFRGDNSTNDPTWSVFLTGVGQRPFLSNASPAAGTIHTVWSILPIASDSTKLNMAVMCQGKATGDPISPATYGLDTPPGICQIWGDGATMQSPTGPYPFATNNYLRLPAMATDLNGNSLRLGAPVHLEITDPAKADFILEQPPQHAAWLDFGQGPTVQTINRYPTFNTALVDSTGKSFTSNNQDHLDWNAGGSIQGTAQGSFTAGEKGEVLGEDLEATNTTKLKLTAKVTYDYDKVSNSYNSNYDSYTVGRGAVTGQDDSLLVEAQILDLWRYRVYGQGTTSGNLNDFYEIVIPGGYRSANPGGRDTDWYQPVHEVGNILSYPDSSQICNPVDIGPITIPNTDITNKAQPLIDCSEQFYNGNGSTLSLQLTDTQGSGSTTDYTHKLHADVDFSVTNTTKTYFGGTGATVQFGLDLDAHGGADWGQLTTSDNSTSSATGISINSPQGDSQYAYPYFPILYNTTAGGLKVAYGLGDITSSVSGGEFWTNNYGTAPDPALNLPNRFKATYGPGGNLDGWAGETTIVRKRMKGFFVRRPDLDPVTNTYPLLGSNPNDGDKVLLDVRVYNYSISATPAGPFTVQFSVIPYDRNTNNEICPGIPTTGKGGRVCPASARQVIGNGNSNGSTAIAITGRTYKDVYLTWDTSGFGPPAPGASEYRVYVDLITNGENELYPPEKPCTAIPCEDNFSNELNIDPGQNNEGWELIAVQKAALGGTLGVADTTGGTLGSGGADTQAAEATSAAASDATVAANRHKKAKKPKPLTAFLYQPFPLQITAFSNGINPLHGHVAIYDGDPDKRKSKTLHGVTPDGTSSWFSWTPTKKGPHHLYAVIRSSRGDTPLGDVVIRVRRAPGDLNEDGRVDRHDLNMLQRDLGKRAERSACGDECDLDGDGMITQKDADLMAHLCDSRDCAFARTEYVGGASPLEPDMRSVRNGDEAESTAFLAEQPKDTDILSASSNAETSALYTAELERKQALRNIHYYYKGKPVTKGPFAQGQ